MSPRLSTAKNNGLKYRARLLLAGYTVRSFAAAHGFIEETVDAAINGRRHGAESKKILAAIERTCAHLEIKEVCRG